MKKHLALSMVFLAILTLVACAKPAPQTLRLATTTSTENSGLLDYILPDFEAKYDAKVEVIAQGTGQALATASNGDADVVLVHDRAKEDAFVASGDGIDHKDVMYNDFVIVGPQSDPAGISGMKDAAAAFQKIAEVGSTFISRGDESGTHSKELAVWKKAGLEPTGNWYVSAGQGMGQVLTMADEEQAYTLSDRGTYLARTKEGLDLVILVEGDPFLFNPYGVIVVNPEKHSGVNSELAEKFVRWITSADTQRMIGEFGVADFGQPLFVPDSEEWQEAQGE